MHTMISVITNSEHVIDARLYRELFHAFDQGFCVFEVLLDASGTPVDYRFLEVNEPFERLTGLVAPVGRTALELVPNLERHWIEIYGRVALTGESTRFVQGSDAMGRWFEVYAARVGAPERRMVALLFSDITARRREQEERKRVDEALRLSELRFREFADTAPVMLWVTESDGTCSYLSRGWSDYTGQPTVEGLGFGWLEMVHSEDRDQAHRLFAKASAAHTAFELEHRLKRADGAYRWVIDAGRPRFRDDGAFDGFIGAVIDINDRKVAEDRLDFAVNSGDVGLWYCDLPFDVLQWTPQVKAHFGLPPDAVVTLDVFFERIHPDDREPTRAAIEGSIAAHTNYDTQYRTVGLDGRTRWIRAIGRARYDDGRPISFDGVTIDISELVMLREEAENANRAKDDFLAMLGHELRNPLAPILTALQLVKLRGVEAVERERAIIERQVRHLVGLVDDLLDVSRITRGRLELSRERIEIADVVSRAIEIASPLLEQHRHFLELDVPRGLIVYGDAGRLAQVVANLLTNAAKYTEPGGQIYVSAAHDGDELLLRVRDTGVGIEPDILPRIFDRFVQQRQTLARSQGGLGLGLAIVRSLVELHGGTVTVTSQGRGHGSEFVVRLPLAADVTVHHTAAVGAASSGSALGTGARVLIVDDNQDAAAMLSTLLREFGYETRVAFDGPTALTAAETFEPDLALLDLGLPVMDGFELAHRFRRDVKLERTRLIAVTGYGQQADRDASREAGFAAHIVKPVDAAVLRELLKDVEGA